MVRIRSNFVSGVIDNNPLAIGDLTLNATELADLAVVASPDIAAIILDPAGSAGDPEIVHVTAHSGSATTATIIRAREGTVAREHLLSVAWVHGPTKQDLTPPREMFIYAVAETGVPATFPYTTSFGATRFSTTTLAAADIARFLWKVPSDFNLLDDISVIIIPDASETIDWNADADYGALGENANNSTEGVDNNTLAVTINKLTAVDVSDVHTGIAAEDYVATQFASNTSSLQVVGLRIKYN